MNPSFCRRLGCALVLLPAHLALAQPLSPQDPYFQAEQGNPNIPQPTPPQIGASSLPATAAAKVPAVLNKADLRANLALTEALINRAMLNQQWDLLADLLGLYAQIHKHDPILLDYAQGALHRHQGRHQQAIAAYRRILAAQPELSYVRLDLAIMLYEDKQYAAAQDQLYRLKADQINAQAQALADVYLQRIRQQMGWQYALSASYVRNDNVNNASAMRELAHGGRKTEDSLPKSGQGIRYRAGLSRDFGLGGNHYGYLGASLDGTHYWNQPDYREQILRISSGYKNQNIKQWFNVLPFVEKNRFGGAAYSTNNGVDVEYGRWLDPRWQVSGYYNLTHKRYDNPLNRRFEGNSQTVSLTAARLLSAALMLYGGVDIMYDDVRDQAESSLRRGVRLGLAREWTGGLSTRMDVRYAYRRFQEQPAAAVAQWSGYDFRRRDHEYQAGLTVWHRAAHWYGVTPKLNLRYVKIDSNMPAFYRRQNWQSFISLEKTF